MCGRSSLTLTEKQLEARFGSRFYSEDLERYNPLPNFNVAPTHCMPIIPMEDPHHFRPMAWGLIPFWAKTSAIGSKMINARVETLNEKPAFRQCLSTKRCIVPMDAWYEWIKQGKARIPYRIFVENQIAFGVAGLFDCWKKSDGSLLYSYTVITREAAPAIAHIHDRMPAVLSAELEKHWIDDTLSPTQTLDLLRQMPSFSFGYHRISDRINKVANNDEYLIVSLDETGNNEDQIGQLSLF
jgi:putative SOS response-associated peptidase YedK